MTPLRSITPFGQYQLLDRLAVGGMAELFLAVRVGEAGFKRACVVKRVLPYLAESPEFVRMFLDEARIAARLQHPGVVQVFELGRHEAAYFIAMEYLPGTDLVRLLRQVQQARQPVPMAIVVRVVAQAAEALHYAHELRDEHGQSLGIVHRDISPSNLFVTCQGNVKVLDFGVAFAREREQHTETGQVKGKAGYMSPEQCLGQTVDRRADVWALGVVAYELLTGERLFDGKTTAQSALAVCQKPIVPVHQLRPEVPQALTAAIMRALERDTGARWATALALQSALEAALPDRVDARAVADHLRSLFGEQWVADQMAHTAPAIAHARGGGTEPLQSAAVGPEAPTQLASGVGTAPATAVGRRSFRGAVRLLGAALVLTIAAALALNAFGARGAPPVTAANPKPPPVAPSPPSAAPPSAGAPSPRPASTPLATAMTVPARAEKALATRETATVHSVRSAAGVRAEKSEPVDARRPTTGHLTLLTVPYATVSFNGRELGPTPLFDVELPTGKLRLTLTGEDGVARALDVTVQAAVATQMRLRLDRLPLAPPR
jgi:serine/threonine-protein kinase